MVNFLGRLAGHREEKESWIHAGIGEEILAAAELELDEPSKKKHVAFCRRIVIARWRTYLKGARIYLGAAEAERRLDAIKQWESKFTRGDKDDGRAYR